MAKLKDKDKNKLWLAYLQAWAKEAPEQKVTSEDLLDLVLVSRFLDIDCSVWQQLLTYFLNQDEKRCRDNFNWNQKEDIIPSGLTFEEYIALILHSPETNFPPGHLFWQAHGVSNHAEWKDLHLNGFTLAAWLKDRGKLDKIAKTLANAYRNAFGRQGLSDKLIYTDDLQTKVIPDYDVSDFLSRFTDLAGIDLSDFTPKEQERILGLLDFFDQGNKKSSKTGISFKNYYGDQANSEKTQRQRLFKKIEKLTSHGYLKD